MLNSQLYNVVSFHACSGSYWPCKEKGATAAGNGESCSLREVQGRATVFCGCGCGYGLCRCACSCVLLCAACSCVRSGPGRPVCVSGCCPLRTHVCVCQAVCYKGLSTYGLVLCGTCCLLGKFCPGFLLLVFVTCCTASPRFQGPMGRCTCSTCSMQ